MADIKEFRKKYPQYDDMSDEELSFRLYQKHYSDMPLVGFAKSFGLGKKGSLDFLKYASEKGKSLEFKQAEPTVGGYGTGLARATLQGLTFGGGEEVVAGGTALARKAIQGDERAIGDIYEQELERERSRIGQFKEEAPVASTVAEIGGALAVPLGAPKTLGGAIGMGAGTGAAYGFLSGEGGLPERAESAVISGGFGGILGGGLKSATDLIGSSYQGYLQRRAAKAVAQKDARAVEDLYNEANALYERAKQSGATIKAAEYEKFVNDTIKKVSGGFDFSLIKGGIPSSASVVKAMESKIGQDVGLNDLEAIYQLAQMPAGKVTDKAEQRAAQIIKSGVDDFLSGLSPAQVSKGATAPAVKDFFNARDLWSKMRKTQNVQNIIETAKEGGYAGGFEAGIKTQFGKIIRDYNKGKKSGFTKPEIELLKQIQTGTPLGRILAGISYLGFSPSGGRTVPIGGLVTGAITGGAVGGPVGALAGAAIEAGITTSLRAIREMSLENQVRLYQDLISSGRANEVIRQAPEVFRYLADVGTRAGVSMKAQEQ